MSKRKNKNNDKDEQTNKPKHKHKPITPKHAASPEAHVRNVLLLTRPIESLRKRLRDPDNLDDEVHANKRVQLMTLEVRLTSIALPSAAAIRANTVSRLREIIRLRRLASNPDNPRRTAHKKASAQWRPPRPAGRA